jgi:dienelactone hydrolase
MNPRLLLSFLCALCVFVVNFSSLHAQKNETPSPGDAMIDKYLAQETDKLSQRFLDGAKTLDEWKSKLPRLRQEYLYMLGFSPLPEKTPLHATITGTIERENVIIDKLHFQSRPGLYVTGNLYRPNPAASRERERPGEKLPAILYVCGHSGRGRDGNKTAFQDHGMWFASNGYICLVIDTLQLGEIPGIHHGTYREGCWWWQARGYTPAGVECWNGIRAIDYLVSRPDVDPERIGVTGISGGGAATIWIAAADNRVKCAVPVSGMSDLESYVKNKIINHHCDCMLMINTYGWERTTIAALIAPRRCSSAIPTTTRSFPWTPTAASPIACACFTRCTTSRSCSTTTSARAATTTAPTCASPSSNGSTNT